MAKYLLKPITGTMKEGYTLEDQDGNMVYHAQMTKFKLFGASPFEFKNMLTNISEEYVIGKTVTVESSSLGGIIDFLSKRSWFKFEGQKIWDYLHEKGIRIESTINTSKIGMKYNITLEGKNLAVIANSTPKGKSIITLDKYYDVECEEKDLDLVFLVAFSIAKTDQTLLN